MFVPSIDRKRQLAVVVVVPFLLLTAMKCGNSGGTEPTTVAFHAPPLDSDRVAHRTILPQAVVNGKAMSGYVGYVLTIPRTAANPQCDLSYSALSNSSLSIQRYVPAEGISTIPLGEILYQHVVDKSSAANISYLVGTVSVADSDVAEVIVEDAIEQEVDPAKIDLAGLTNLEQSRDTTRVCEYYFVSRAFLTTVKSRTYSRIGGEGQLTYVVNVGGRHYVSTLDFTSKAVLAIDARPLSTLVQPVVRTVSAGVLDTVASPVTAEVAKTILTSETLPDTSKAKLPSVVRLPPSWYDKQRIRMNRVQR